MSLTVFYSNLDICGECFSICHRHLGDKQYAPLGSENLAKNRLFAQFPDANYPGHDWELKVKRRTVLYLTEGTLPGIFVRHFAS